MWATTLQQLTCVDAEWAMHQLGKFRVAFVGGSNLRFGIVSL